MDECSWASGYNGGASDNENLLARSASGIVPLMSTPAIGALKVFINIYKSATLSSKHYIFPLLLQKDIACLSVEK